ncbi:glycoside hydrolase family 3 protein [Jutongia sp.]|uniref:glycoside hydrolase family 3 protein n=1 Tax=Jutongia sp. TaxID=2944204 RepID=UPI00308039A0
MIRVEHERKDPWFQKIKYGKKLCAAGLSISLIVSTVLTGCELPGKSHRNNVYVPPASTDAASTEEPDVIGMSDEDATYASLEYLDLMTDEEKVGQLFTVNLEQIDDTKGEYYEHKKITKTMKENLQKYPVGGVILFSRNIWNRKQTKKLIRKLQKNAAMPMFISVDEEGGDVARIGNNKKMKTDTFPTMEEIGKTQDADYVYYMASTIGSQIGELGFNVDFAPVADVKTSEMNSEIGTRSFGDDPKKVAEFVSAYVKGLESQNICSTLKHFPGQGSSSGDTHQGSVDIDSSISKLRKIDFVPFVSGIEAGADFVMVSHISVSRVTETSEPASVSKLIMTTILREELDYSGLIVTDAFDMACITDKYSAAEAAVKSFNAGADIILMPQDLPETYDAILSKVKSGKITEKRLNDTVERILKLKFQKGIMTLEDTAQKKMGD